MNIKKMSINKGEVEIRLFNMERARQSDAWTLVFSPISGAFEDYIENLYLMDPKEEKYYGTLPHKVFQNSSMIIKNENI